ncbi:MAG: type II secretion system F family protein [Ferrimicrobium sp.]
MLETYDYRAKDREGRVRDGVIDAESRQMVVAHLKDLGYLPVSVRTRRAPLLKRDLSLPIGRRVKLADVAVFSRQFATMIEAGITIMKALSILESQIESAGLRGAVADVRQKISTGDSFGDAVARHSKVFDRLFISMVRAGEASGNLDIVLVRTAESLEKRVELQRKIKSALTYPVAVLSLVLVILTAMLVFVIPTFKSIFASLGGQLPLATRVLLGISHLFVQFLPLVLLFYVALGVGFVRMRRSPKGKAQLDRLSLRLPVFGNLIRKYALARFAATLATLLRSGVNLVPALDIAGEVANNAPITDAVADIREGIAQGEALSGRMGRHPIFPPMVAQMIAVGEESGAVDTLLDKLAIFYQQEVTAVTESLASLLEPLLIVVLGSVVGGMVIALYLPMFDVIKLIK